VTFSLKQLTADPLLETLDTIMPVAMPEPSVDDDELADAPLPGLNDIGANLLAEDGIDAVIPGRQARSMIVPHRSPHDSVRVVNADP
jgi:hypothetical protein